MHELNNALQSYPYCQEAAYTQEQFSNVSNECTDQGRSPPKYKKPSELGPFNASIESQLVGISLSRNPPTSTLLGVVVYGPRLKV